MGITHSTVVAIADDGTSPVGSDEWNDAHVIEGDAVTVTADTPLFGGFTQTWNNAAVAFTALKLNVTGTAFAAQSNLIDLQLGGSSKFRVSFFTGAGEYPTIWLAQNTPSLSNYTIAASDGGATIINSPTTILLRSGHGERWSMATNGSLSNTGQTLTSSSPVLDLSQTWNNAAVAFTALKLNVTDTASNGSGYLIDLQVGGSYKFRVRQDGYGDFSAGIGATNIYTSGISNAWLSFGNQSVKINAVCPVSGDSATTFAVRTYNAATAMALHVYNTSDNSATPTNYERAVFDWTTSANTLTIGTQKGGTGTDRDVKIASTGNVSFLRGGTTAEILFTGNGHYPGANNQNVDLGYAGGSFSWRNCTIFGFYTSEASSKTIATGAITATGSYTIVDTEASAATDDLDTITIGGGASIAGATIILRAANTARTVVCKDGTGNLKLAGDFSLDNTEDTIMLIYDGTNWLEVSRSDNGA